MNIHEYLDKDEKARQAIRKSLSTGDLYALDECLSGYFDVREQDKQRNQQEKLK